MATDDHRKYKNFVAESGNGRIAGKDNIELFDDWDSTNNGHRGLSNDSKLRKDRPFIHLVRRGVDKSR